MCLETFPSSPHSSTSMQSPLMSPLMSMASQQPEPTFPWTMLPLQGKEECNEHSMDDSTTTCSGHAAEVESGNQSASELAWFEEDKDCCSSSAELSEATTLMICNIPCRLGRADIVKAIHSVGFVDKYDFVHMPGRRHGSKRNGNMGYAFVNFKSTQDAEQFVVAFENFQFPGTCSAKRCTLKFAHLQGFNAVDASPSSSHRPWSKRS